MKLRINGEFDISGITEVVVGKRGGKQTRYTKYKEDDVWVIMPFDPSTPMNNMNKLVGTEAMMRKIKGMAASGAVHVWFSGETMHFIPMYYAQNKGGK